MSSFNLEIDINAAFGGGAPTLEILIGGIVVSSVSVSAGISTLSFLLDHTGNFPSSLQFRFNGGSGSGGDTLSFDEVRVNGQEVVASDLTSTLLSQGNTSTQNIANTDHLFGRVEPTQADLGTATITGTGGADVLNGTVAKDVIDGGGGNDRIRGSDGDDAINGGAGNDTIFGEAGNDIIIGGSENDLIFGGAGDDLLFGQDDNDILIGQDGNDTLNGGLGDDALLGGAGDDILYGEGGVDTLIGQSGDDVLYGDAGNDSLIGGDGDDILYGGADNDRLHGEADNDIIYGEAGADEISGGTGIDTIDGGIGNDIIHGEDGNDIIDGGDNDDLITGGAGADTINGDGGADYINGGLGADTIDGGAGNDVIHGNGLDIATISALTFANPSITYSQETGSFYQYVSAGANWGVAAAAAAGTTLNGLNGHLVTITTQAENDFIESMLNVGTTAWTSGSGEGAGADWVWSSGLEAGIQWSSGSTAVNNMYENWLASEPNDGSGDTVYARLREGNNDWTDRPDSDALHYVIEWEAGLMADDGANDILSGGAGNDHIYGFDGDDTLNGDGDNDVVFGGAGSDTLNGGTGDDVLYAFDGTVSTAAAIIAGATVTILDEAFGSNTGVFAYTDGGFGGTDGANVSVTGTRLTSDGDAANGSLRVFVDGQNNNSFTNGSGSWDASVSHTADLSNAQITFSYKHIHRNQNDNGEDSQVYFEFDGNIIDTSGGASFISEALGSGGATDTGWITVTIDLPDLTASTVYNLSMGILHTGSSRSNEDAEVRFDDITITGDEAAVGGPPTTNNADIGEINIVNGGSGADVIYGSAGTDTLNGDAGVDTIYSASANEAWDAAVAQILTDNAGVVYSAETNSFYQHVTANTQWIAANTAANAATLTGLAGNGYLATVTSQAENDYIFSVAGGNRLWIGGADVSSEGNWSWTNSSSGADSGLQFWGGGAGGGATNSHYSNWLSGAGEPSNGNSTWDYTEYRADGTWWTNASTRALDYVIEWDADALIATVDFTTISGGADNDVLYGNDGIDVFDFNDTASLDTIENFSASGRDALDISDILSGYTYTGSDINDFVRLTESGGNTTIAVDANGVGGYTDIAVLNGVTGLDLYQMIAADNLIV